MAIFAKTIIIIVRKVEIDVCVKWEIYMRTHLGCKIAADGFVFCQRFLSLSLALVMLCDAGLWAATPVSSQHIEQHVRQEVAKAVPTQSPQQFLQKLRLDMEQLVTSASVKEPEDLDGYSLQEYSTRYQKEVEKFYSKQVEQVEQEAKTALATS